MTSNLRHIQARRAIMKPKSAQIDGEKHVAYKGKDGDIHVDHPGKKSGKYKDINLTKETRGKVKNTQQGIKAAKNWHKKSG